jgi:hypothetical protein
VGSTVQEEDDLSLLYHDDNPRFLNFDIKEWSLDRRSYDPSIQGRWHHTFCPETGALRPPMLPFHMGHGPGGGWGSLPGCLLRQTPGCLALSHIELGPGEVSLRAVARNVAGRCQELLPPHAKELAREAAD